MSGKERKRDKVKKKIKKLYERLKKSTDLPKEVRLQVQTALQDVSGPSLYIGGDLPVAKPNRENTVFQRITAIVLEVGDQNPSFQGFSAHPWDPKKQKKGTLADQIRQLDFPEVYNLIRRIHRELNQEKRFDEEPNPNAIQAIKGLMQSLTKTERGTIIGISTDDEVNSFITDCCQNTIITTLNQCILLDSMDDSTYYSLFVGNALDRVQRDYVWSWCADNAPYPS
jgi:hypothetical protein